MGDRISKTTDKRLKRARTELNHSSASDSKKRPEKQTKTGEFAHPKLRLHEKMFGAPSSDAGDNEDFTDMPVEESSLSRTREDRAKSFLGTLSGNTFNRLPEITKYDRSFYELYQRIGRINGEFGKGHGGNFAYDNEEIETMSSSELADAFMIHLRDNSKTKKDSELYQQIENAYRANQKSHEQTYSGRSDLAGLFAVPDKPKKLKKDKGKKTGSQDKAPFSDRPSGQGGIGGPGSSVEQYRNDVEPGKGENFKEDRANPFLEMLSSGDIFDRLKEITEYDRKFYEMQHRLGIINGAHRRSRFKYDNKEIETMSGSELAGAFMVYLRDNSNTKRDSELYQQIEATYWGLDYDSYQKD